MVRALKVLSDELDANLVKLQEEGEGINQIIPCPESISFEDGMAEGKSFDGGVKMIFMIIYSEKQQND